MRYTGSYAVVLVLHLLAALFVVGPLAVTAVTSPRLARAGSVDALRTAERMTRAYALASVVVVLLGAVLVGSSGPGEAWEQSQLWVSASYGLWFVAVALTLGLVVPAQRKAVKALEAGEDTADAAGRMTLGGGLAMLAWVLIVVLMVVKPGA